MTELKILDMETVVLSVDKVGKIFFYKNRIFRAINNDYIDYVKDMFSSGLIEEIAEKKLFPRTWISDIKIENYSLVIEHEKILHWNYPYEWSFDMLRDAGLAILEVNEIANMIYLKFIFFILFFYSTFYFFFCDIISSCQPLYNFLKTITK